MVGAANATKVAVAFAASCDARPRSSVHRDYRASASRRAIFRCDARLELVRLSL